jgi:hypothetical protein
MTSGSQDGTGDHSFQKLLETSQNTILLVRQDEVHCFGGQGKAVVVAVTIWKERGLAFAGVVGMQD